MEGEAIIEPEDSGAGRPALWTVLAHSDYRNLWIAQNISVLGDKLYQIALALLVYEVTGSMIQMGVMLGVTTLPAVLVGPFAGVFTDRWDRRETMIVSDVMRAGLLVLVMPLAGQSVALVYFLAFGVSTVSLFFEPARLALVPELVPPERLVTANSADQFGMGVSELAGLAIGGALVAGIGTAGAFYVNAATFLLSAGFVWAVAYRPDGPEQLQFADRTSARQRLFGELHEGLNVIWSSSILRSLTIVYSVAALAGMALITLIHLLALFSFDGGAGTLAAFDVAITVGLLLGGVLVNRMPTNQGVTFALGLGALSLMCFGLATSTNYLVILALLGAAGIANTFFAVASVTITQQHTAPRLRGRVFALRSALTRTTGVVGLVGAGVLAELTSVSFAIALNGVIMILATVAAFSITVLRRA